MIQEFLPYVVIGTCFAVGNSIVWIAFKFSDIVKQLEELNELLKKNKE